MGEFSDGPSGWSLDSIINLSINIGKLNPMRAGCHIPLPNEISNKNACVNVKNDDDMCVIWAILAGLSHKRIHPERTYHYKKHLKKINCKGIEFPFNIKQARKLDEQNDKFSLNIYALEKIKNKYIVLPVYCSSNKKLKHINLLHFQDNYSENDGSEGENLPNAHFAWIKNLSRLCRSQITSDISSKNSTNTLSWTHYRTINST